MFFRRKNISQKAFFQEVAKGRRIRIIDLRGDYRITLPGAIPSTFEEDIFYEEESWVQDMLGIPFEREVPLILVCEFGQVGWEAVDHFYRKNPKSVFEIANLNGGMVEYRTYIKRLTEKFRNKEAFCRELTDIRTPPQRFTKIARGLLENRSFINKLIG